jgi:antitoxin VapB
MRNLNIKSDEAYELAHFIAKRTGKTLTAAVTDLLKREKRALTKDELIEKWTRIGKENRTRMSPEMRDWDYDADMYDEWGLPK